MFTQLFVRPSVVACQVNAPYVDGRRRDTDQPGNTERSVDRQEA